MGNGPLNNSIGYGDATVFNPNPAIQQFGNIIAQQKAEKQAKDQALISQMAQLKPDALRDADKSDYLNKYNDWKQTAIDANNLPRNSRDRLDKIAQAQQKYSDLGSYIDESKKEAAHENSVSNMLLSNPHLFSDDAHQKLIKSMQSPMSDSNFIPATHYGNLERYVDPVKQDDGFDKANKALLKQTAWGNPIQSDGKDKQGNKTGVVVHNERQVDPADILATHAHMYDLSPDTRNYIDKKYANITGSSPAETKMLRLKQNAIDRQDISVGNDGALQSGVNEQTKPTFKANTAPDKFYEHHMFIVNNPTASQAASQQPTYFQDLSERMRKGVSGSGEEFNQQVAQNPIYGGKGLNIDNTDPKNVKFIVPAKYKYSPNATNADEKGRIIDKPAYTTTLDSTNPDQWTAGFSRIYRDVTGDNSATPTKAMTPYGKGKVPGGLSRTNTETPSNKVKPTANHYGL